MNSIKKDTTPPLLQRVYVDALFGQYTYDIDFSGGLTSEGNISIIYGANATGKTTLLRLIYNSLSHELGAGTKSNVAKTPFSHLEIHLTNSAKVIVKKPDLIGGYSIDIFDQHGQCRAHHIRVNSENAVRNDDNPDLKDLAAALSALNIDLFHITDRREYFTTIEYLRPPPQSAGIDK